MLQETNEQKNTEKDSENGTMIRTGIFIVIISILVIAVFVLLSNKSTQNSDEPYVENYESQQGIYAEQENGEITYSKNEVDVSDFLQKPKFTEKENTSAMIDQIAHTAKNNVYLFTGYNADDIVKTIKATTPNFYDDNSKMEKFMWYGYLLDYKYDDSSPLSKLGTSLVRAIKYVYRKEEKISDDSTWDNISQVDEILNSLNGEQFSIDDSDSLPEESIYEEDNAVETPKPKPRKTPKPVPIGCQNALDKAESYLDSMAFSKKGLKKQLKYEGYTAKEVKYAINHITVNWNEQASQKARDYLDSMSFSKSGLIKQLKYEGFTDKQAKYGVKKAGY